MSGLRPLTVQAMLPSMFTLIEVGMGAGTGCRGGALKTLTIPVIDG
jgi:hypothetical protein